MQHDTETAARPAILTAAPMASIGHLLGAWAAIAAVGVARIVAFGWAPISPDDSLYILVGRGVLSGAGPTWRGGVLWLDRSPVFGTLLAVGDRLYPSDVFTGAHVVAFGLAMGSVAAMLVLANMLAGRIAMWASTFGLVAMTLWWRLLPAVRIDFVHIAWILVAIILLSIRHRPRWVLAGVAVGVAILVKESAIFLIGLPVAFIGTIPARDVLVGFGRYLAGFAATVAWWWVYVFINTGEIYLVTDGVDAPARLGFADTSWHWTTMLALIVVVVSWILLAVRHARHPAARLLILAAIAFVPRFVLTYTLGLEPRLYLTGLVLSLVVVGIASTDVWTSIRVRRSPDRHRGIKVAGYVGVGVLVMAAVVIGQTSVPRHGVQPTEVADVARAVEAALPRGSRIAVSFKHRGLLALYTDDGYGQVTMWPENVDLDQPGWETMQWVTLRAGILRGITRPRWQEIRGEADGLVIFWPHVLSSAALWPLLADDRAYDLGYEPGVVHGDVGRGVFVVVDDSSRRSSEATLLHATTKAAIEILEENVDAVGFLAEDAVVRGSFKELDVLESLLPPGLCTIDLRDEYEPGVAQIAHGADCVDPEQKRP